MLTEVYSTAEGVVFLYVYADPSHESRSPSLSQQKI
jgi:hypothetical protein